MTSLIEIIKNALLALTLYLKLKNKAFYYDILKESNKLQEDIINEIEKLRNKGTSHSNDSADILRSKLLAERERIEHLSAYYTKTERE